MAMMRILISVFLFTILCSGSPAGASELSELRAKAKSGDAVAQYDLGSFYYNQDSKGRRKIKDNQQAVLWYTKAAEKGHANAQFGLGRMYVTGKGVARDVELGVSWQLKAAEQGLANAQFAIGKRYFLGVGLVQDHQQAQVMILKAAEQGLVGAQSQLGMIYFQGNEGIPRDLVQAHKWFNIASSSDDEPAKQYRSLLEEIMDQSQIEEAQRLAKEWAAEHETEQAN